MYLHKNREIFEDAVNLAVRNTGLVAAVIEKDYYVSMILRLLAERFPNAVFKGGTSLQKTHKVIKRFSEDIDIAVDSRLGDGKKRRLKKTILGLAEELGVSVCNEEEIRSRRNYNRYEIAYQSVAKMEGEVFEPLVYLETSFATVSFPTVKMAVSNYIGEMMEKENPQMAREYQLEPFEMQLQSLERTLVDKIFAICDYYLSGKIERHSRHIYDIYKLLPLVEMNGDFQKLVDEVRKVRKQADVCPSAQDGVDVAEVLREIVEKKVYQADYLASTAHLLEENVSYEEAIRAVEEIWEKQVASIK